MTTESIPSFDLATHLQFREDGNYLSSIWPQVRKRSTLTVMWQSTRVRLWLPTRH